MQFFYNIGIRLYAFAILIASLFNAKARAWVSGRKNWQSKYAQLISSSEKKTVIWFHCASLGEFEMARPVIEKLKAIYNHKITVIISFFSPSGYLVQQNYKMADAVVYLPIDSAKNAKKFVQLFNPTIAIFVKYEIWINYFKALKQNRTELILMNAVFRTDQRFFKWYGNIFRDALKLVDKIFVQNDESQQLLNKFNIVTEVTGDTRYDRVMQIKEQPKNVDEIKKWVNGQYCIVCGSTWPAEEKVIQQLIVKLPDTVKWIIVPHDVSENHIEKIVDLFYQHQVVLSKMKNDDYGKNVLIVDSVGKLSQIYSLANLAIVGGGFSGKLHNILEPAVYGIPILFGPKYARFKEAVDMIEQKSAISFYDETDIILYIEWFYYDHVMVDNVKASQVKMFEKNKGAVDKIFRFIDKQIDKRFS